MHVCSPDCCDHQGQCTGINSCCTYLTVFQACKRSEEAVQNDSTRLLGMRILLLELYFNQPVESFYAHGSAPDLPNELNAWARPSVG